MQTKVRKFRCPRALPTGHRCISVVLSFGAQTSRLRVRVRIGASLIYRTVDRQRARTGAVGGNRFQQVKRLERPLVP